MEARGTALAADGYELAVTRFPAEGRAGATLLCAGARKAAVWTDALDWLCSESSAENR